MPRKRKPVPPVRLVASWTVRPLVLPRVVPLTLMDAIERGTRLEILVAQRREAAASLAGLSGAALAAMHRQIALLGKEIEEIQSAETEGTDIGDAIDAPDEEYDPEAEEE